MASDSATLLHITNIRFGHAIWDQIASLTPLPRYNSTNGWRILYLPIGSPSSGTLGNTHNVGRVACIEPLHRQRGDRQQYDCQGESKLGHQDAGPVWCDVNSAAGQCIATDNTAPCFYSYLSNKHPIGIFAATSGYTEQVVVSDNKLLGAGSPYLVVTGPQNANRDERVRDVIFERNWFKAGNNATRVALVIHSYETTVRNNICDMTGGDSGVTCFNPTLYGDSPARAPHDIRIYNNTGYKSGAGSKFVLVKTDTTSTNGLCAPLRVCAHVQWHRRFWLF
jgi:hypothetical protein